MIHDFLTVFEIYQIEKHILPKLTYEKSKSLIIDTESSETSIPDHYKASSIFFKDIYTTSTKETTVPAALKKHDTNKRHVMAAITQRIQLASYLIIANEDRKGSFKASLYGLGGMTEKHGDGYGIEDNIKINNVRKDYFTDGDIIATIILWMTNVNLGGGTYFCSQTVEDVIQPEKGSALLWMNLKASGFVDHSQHHGGCPVAEGTKFVLTHWFLHYYQWKKFPCEITKNTMINVRKILHTTK